MSHWSSSLGSGPITAAPTPGVPGCGVPGPAGDPVLTCVEKGEPAGMEDATESVLVRILEAGRSTSWGSYGQLREIVVVKGMKKFSKETVGLVAVRRSRSLGLGVISHVSFLCT